MQIDDDLTDAHILVVDDEESNVMLLKKILRRAGFTNVDGVTDSRLAASIAVDSAPDLILLDLNMPFVDGYGVLEDLHDWMSDQVYLPIIILTADITQATRQRALALGVQDFLTKPFDPDEMLLRLRTLLRTRYLHLDLQEQNSTLEQRVRLRTLDLERAGDEILQRLARAAEYRDDDTGQHTRRVSTLVYHIAQHMGLPLDRCVLLAKASPLHDVGKIGIPDGILLKPGRLTDYELATMRLHTTIGAEILGQSTFPLLEIATTIALTHHERWNGSGYPRGLAGEDIPLCGRIVAIADVFDALTHERPYKKAWTRDEALAEIVSHAGALFDPAGVTALQHLISNDTLADFDALGHAAPPLEEALL